MKTLEHNPLPYASVAELLDGLGLLGYADIFAENDIELDILPELTDRDLKELGIRSLGHRRRLLREIGATFGTGPAVPDGDAPPTPDEAENAPWKRQVTVLFADLSNFTKLTEGMAGEDALAMVREFYGVVDPIVEQFGGKVENHMGDCTLAVFGLHSTTGHDSLRAVRAAERISAAFRGRTSATGAPLGVHVGVASGHVVILGSQVGSLSDGSYTLTGASLNLASRLADAADDGEVLISDDIYRTLADHVDVTVRDGLRLRGIEGPVRAWLLARTTDPAVPRIFVGRSAELQSLRRALDRTKQDSRGKVVCVAGEAGMGKSSLCRWFLSDGAAGGVPVHEALVLDYGAGHKSHAVRELARSFLGRPDRETMQDAIETWLEAGKAEPEVRLGLYHLAGAALPAPLVKLDDALGTAGRDAAMRAALGILAARHADRGPVIVFLEDLHWADARVRDAVRDLAQVARTRPLLLLLTTRFQQSRIDEQLRAKLGREGVETLELSALDQSEAETLAQSLADRVSADLVATCLDRAQGHPLFLRQLMAHLSAGPSDAVPNSIEGLVQSRLDQIPAVDRQALRAASVLGQRFSVDAVRWLLGDDGYAMDGLVAADLVQPMGKEYLFAHALIRDSAYRLLVRERRQALHAAAAVWFKDTDPDLHAVHLDRAGDPGAAAAYLEACRAMFAANRPDMARKLALAGRRLKPARPIRAALELELGRLALDAGDANASLGAFGEALRLAGSAGDVVTAMIGQVQAMRVIDRIDQALAVLDDAQAIAEAEGIDAALAQIHYLRGSLYFPRGNIDGCRAEHARAVAFARSCGSAEFEAQARSGLGDAAYAAGRMRTAHAEFTRCLELARRHELGRIEAANLFMLGTVRIYLNETEAALADALNSAEIAVQTRAQRPEIVSRLTAGWVLISMGRLAEAHREITRGLEISGALGARRFDLFLQESLARVLFLQGDRAAAGALIAETVDGALDQARTFIGPWVLGTAARLSRDPDKRRSWLDQGETILAEGCVGHNAFRFRHAAIEVALQDRDPQALHRQADALAAYTRGEPVPWSDFHIARARVLARVFETGGADGETAQELGRLAGIARSARFAGLAADLAARAGN